jgi:hypothetical protein
VPDDYYDYMLIGGSRAWSQKKKKAEIFSMRFWFSLLGGMALICPMILMVLLQGYRSIVSLTTPSVSTILFSLLMARFSDAPPLAVVATTAAYAAYAVGLVVFVGSSS